MDIRKIELADFFDFCVTELKWNANRYHQMHSCLSSFSAWIENYFDEDYPMFRNLLPKIEKPVKENIREKTVLQKEDIDKLMNYLEENDEVLARKVEPLEEIIDVLRMELKNRHILRLKEDKCTIELGFIFSDLLSNLERVSDHCSNIGGCVIEIAQFVLLNLKKKNLKLMNISQISNRMMRNLKRCATIM